MFNVGQKVVCIKAHSQGVLNVGKIYTIYGTSYCRCKLDLIDVGVPSVRRWRCGLCNEVINNSTWWFDARLFAYLEEKGESFIEEFVDVCESDKYIHF